MQESKPIEVYTDGACSDNNIRINRGGWGAIILYPDGNIEELFGGELNTSNQKMELIACIKALERIGRTRDLVIVYSDSAYLVNCMEDLWYEKWRRNGWKNSLKKPVENQDLWMSLLKLTDRLSITFIKVKGHSGNEWNERADELSIYGMNQMNEF